MGKRGYMLFWGMGILFLSSCQFGGNLPITLIPKGDFLFIVTTDFSSGSFAVYAQQQGLMSTGYSPIHSDATAVFHSGKIFVLNRFGADNLQILEPQNQFQTIRQMSTNTPPGCAQFSNPYDLDFFREDEAVLSRYGCKSALIVKPFTAEITGEIDLSEYADSDGIPEMAYGFVYRSTYFLSLQKLTEFQPVNVSTLLMMDLNEGRISGEIPLVGKNPVTEWVEYLPGKFIGAVTGKFSIPDGGVEEIDAEQKRSLGIILTEEQLDGEVSALTGFGGNIYLAVSGFGCNDFDPQTPCESHLLSWSRALGIREIFQSPAPLGHLAISVDRTLLYVSDRSLAGGLRIFRLSDGEQLSVTPLNTGLPPYWLVPFRLQ